MTDRAHRSATLPWWWEGAVLSFATDGRAVAHHGSAAASRSTAAERSLKEPGAEQRIPRNMLPADPHVDGVRAESRAVARGAKPTVDQAAASACAAARRAIAACKRYRARAKAVRRGQEAVTGRRSAGDRRGEAVELNALGKAYRERGLHAEAVVCYTQALSIFREIDSRRGEGLSLSNLGLAYDAQGNRTKAVSCYEAAVEIFRALGDRQIEGQILANLGTTYRRQGQRQRATEVWRQAFGLVSPGTRVHKRLAERLGAAT